MMLAFRRARSRCASLLSIGLLLAATLGVLAAGEARAQAKPMPMVNLSAGMFRIEAEVAATFEDRQRGLMYREAMPANRGMIFVFPESATHCMWMKNTSLPLAVAFLDDEGRILNVAEMQPHTETSHCAAGRARYALEMNQGWFSAKGLGAGQSIRGIEGLPKAH